MRHKILYLIVVFSYFLNSSALMAQNNAAAYGISVPVDGEVVNGSVICAKGASFGLCEEFYDSDMLGVVADNSAVALEATDPGSQRLVIQEGVVKVRVTTSEGNIVEGDLITSSDTPGVGAKATSNGYVLGSALEAYESSDPAAIGEIAVAVNVHLRAGLEGRRTNLLNLLRRGLSSLAFEPLDSLRYALAIIVVIMSLGLGIMYFGRVAKAGVEAMGRNPLAKNSIQMSIVLSIMLSFVMIIVGLALAYLILVL